MGLNSGLVITNTFHSTVYESLGIQLWITKMWTELWKDKLEAIMFYMAVISLVFSRVIEVCMFSSLSPSCSLRPAPGGMRIDVRFSFWPFPCNPLLVLCVGLCHGQEPTVLPRLKLQLFTLCAFSMSMCWTLLLICPSSNDCLGSPFWRVYCCILTLVMLLLFSLYCNLSACYMYNKLVRWAIYNLYLKLSI